MTTIQFIVALVLVLGSGQIFLCGSETVGGNRSLLPNIQLVLKKGASNYFSGQYSSILSFFKENSGDLYVKGTPLVFHYVAHKCSLSLGKRRKRFIFESVSKCVATVTEKITKESASCTTHKQTDSINCAATKVLERIKQLIIKSLTTPESFR